MKEPRLLLIKSHVSAYTRKDGTFVAEHDDKRSKKADQPVAKKPHATETENFKKWFRGSRVVDDHGKPMVVYHGTSEQFDIFDPKKAGMGNDRGMRGRGLYFSPNEKTAASYGANIMPVYVSIQKPFNPADFKSKEEIAERLGIDEDYFEYTPDGGFRVYQSFSGTFTSALKDAGYDGVIYPQRQEVIAFYPEQIKSANGNNGNFDPNQASMTKAIMVVCRR